jgi:serine/threonine-protein kinase ULK4
MDKYHIYEEIGKGEFSQVFKGREKKKIEYVAIKRVEKSMMSKVVINSYPCVILCTLTFDSKP